MASAQRLAKTNNTVRDKSNAKQLQKDRAAPNGAGTGAGYPIQYKTTFRTVVSNPYNLDWPSLPASTRRTILESLVNCLESKDAFDTSISGERERELTIKEWREGEHERKRNHKGKEADRSQGKGKERKRNPSHSMSIQEVVTPMEPLPSITSASSSALPKPHLLSHLSVGINDVTRALEAQIRWGRWELGDETASPMFSSKRATVTGRRDDRNKKKQRRIEERVGEGEKDKEKNLGRVERTATRREDGKRLRTHARGKIVTETEVVPEEKEGEHKKEVDSQSTPASGAHEESTGTSNRQSPLDATSHLPPSYSFLSSPPPPLPTLTSVPYLTEPTLTQPPLLLPNSPLSPHPFLINSSTEPNKLPLIDLIFVCKPDINPVQLVDHLPMMVGAANGVGRGIEERLRLHHHPTEEGTERRKMEDRTRMAWKDIMLVPLDKGAEKILADILGLRRVAVIGLSSSHPLFHQLRTLVSSVLTPLLTPWLIPHLLPPHSTAHLIPTHIKHLKTLAPNDLKGFVERKKAGKIVVREESKQRKQILRRAEREKRRQKREERGRGEKEIYYATDD